MATGFTFDLPPDQWRRMDRATYYKTRSYLRLMRRSIAKEADRMFEAALRDAVVFGGTTIIRMELPK